MSSTLSSLDTEVSVCWNGATLLYLRLDHKYRVLVSVCLSVCVCVSTITQKARKVFKKKHTCGLLLAQLGYTFLAHLWGAYAIPVALSGVRRPSSVVRRVSSVSTITTRNN